MEIDAIDNTNLIAVMFVVAMGLLTLVLPKGKAILPLLLTASFLTLGQRVNILGANFTFLRIVIAVGWVRLAIRGEIHRLRITGVDRALLFWTLASVIMGTLLEYSTDGFVNRLGLAYNAIGMYFLFRYLIIESSDREIIFKYYAVTVCILSGVMLIEYVTSRNMFHVFGGVPEYAMIRDGRMRCQGPFRHPILAGTYGAGLVPLLISQLHPNSKNKMMFSVGLMCAVSLVIFSSSSGPLLALLAGIIGVLMWPLRNGMKYVRRSMLVLLIGLSLFMKAPVWFIIGKLSNITGGTGWHRSEIIDKAIEHFDEWWFVGTKYTKHWMPHDTLSDPNMIDITNQYILEGVSGGIIRLALFINILVTSFRIIGNMLKDDSHNINIFSLWCVGVALAVHATSFISVSYFDQIIVLWYLTLAIVATYERQYVVAP